MATNADFSDAHVAALHRAKIIGVRAGSTHRYTGVWVVVADGRVFVRSWNDKPTGWFRAFKAEPDGTIQVEGQEIPVRTRPVRSARILGAVTAAFGEKYHTPGSRKWVEGFAEPAREQTTLEVLLR